MRTGNDNLSVENLLDLLQDEDLVVRVHAGFALGTMGAHALPAVPLLIEMLKFGDEQDRKLAATVLGQIGPAAVEAVSALLDAANDEDEGVSDVAVWALERRDTGQTSSATRIFIWWAVATFAHFLAYAGLYIVPACAVVIYAITKINYTYEIPLFLLLTLRGGLGDHHKHHASNSLYLRPVLDAIDLPYRILDAPGDIASISRCYHHTRTFSRPMAVIFTRDVLRGGRP